MGNPLLSLFVEMTVKSFTLFGVVSINGWGRLEALSSLHKPWFQWGILWRNIHIESSQSGNVELIAQDFPRFHGVLLTSILSFRKDSKVSRRIDKTEDAPELIQTSCLTARLTRVEWLCLSGSRLCHSGFEFLLSSSWETAVGKRLQLSCQWS